MLLKGDPALQIARTARDQNVDLIVLSTHGHGVFYRFLLGSVAAKVLHESACPVWTDAHLEEAPAGKFGIYSVVCAVDLSPHSRNTVLRAAQIAEEFGAQLTLVHITGGVEIYGPGTPHIVPEWRQSRRLCHPPFGLAAGSWRLRVGVITRVRTRWNCSQTLTRPPRCSGKQELTLRSNSPFSRVAEVRATPSGTPRIGSGSNTGITLPSSLRCNVIVDEQR